MTAVACDAVSRTKTRWRAAISWGSYIASFALGLLLMHEIRNVNEMRQLTTQVLLSMPSGVIVCGEHGKIKLVNKAAERITGYTPDELSRLGIQVIVPEDLWDAHSAGWQGAMQKLRKDPDSVTTSQRATYPLRMKNGEITRVQLQVAGFFAAGELWFVASMRPANAEWPEITSKKSVEEPVSTLVSDHQLGTDTK